MFSDSDYTDTVATFFKVQGRVMRITLPEGVLIAREFLDLRRQCME